MSCASHCASAASGAVSASAASAAASPHAAAVAAAAPHAAAVATAAPHAAIASAAAPQAFSAISLTGAMEAAGRGLLDAAASGAAGLLATGLHGVVAAVQAPLLALVKATLLSPFTLPSAAVAVWSFARDVALAALLGVLLYGVLRSMVAAASGEAHTPPGRLLPRLLLAACGVQLSLPLVSWLLEANNAFVAAVLAAAGGQSLLQPIAPSPAGTALALAGIGAGLLLSEALQLLLLVGLGWLVLTYALRAAEVVLLTVLAPFAAAAWILPEAAGAWRALCAELLPAVFLQSGQVLVLWLFLRLGAWAAGEAGAGAAGSLVGTLVPLALVFLLSRVRRILAALMAAERRAPGSVQRDWPLPVAAAAGVDVWRRAAGW